MVGLVIKNTGSWYQVKTDREVLIECKIKGNLRLNKIRSTNPIAVGDIVDFELNSDGIGMISAIHDRKNYIVRRSSNLSKQSHILAANIDLVALIATVNYPETSTVFIDRFLASAEAYRVSACIIFNKTDLYNEQETRYLDALEHLYSGLGYKVFRISAKKSVNLESLTGFFREKITLISGNSGVGKSTIINTIAPASMTKTAEISTYHNKGMHTTTFSGMFQLAEGGAVIDTPGIKGFGTVDMNKEEISHFFKEIFIKSGECRFSDCTHVHEPGCAVLKALEDKLISSSRYQSYISMLEECEGGKYR